MRETLNIRFGRHRYAVLFKDIVYMEKMGRKIILHTRRDQREFYGKYDEIFPHLDERFINPHRSFVINMDHIIEMDGNTIKMCSGHSVRFCRECLERSKKSYDEYIAKKLANR